MAASVASQQILKENTFQNEKVITYQLVNNENVNNVNTTPTTPIILNNSIPVPTSSTSSLKPNPKINSKPNNEKDQKLVSIIDKNIKRFGIDQRDVNTSDNWIPRNPNLIRLTGKHPLNCEPPLPLLMEQGFITPNDLHYVRNHGAVPKLDWRTHQLIIDG